MHAFGDEQHCGRRAERHRANVDVYEDAANVTVDNAVLPVENGTDGNTL
ncbi:MAG: hypothetical protein WDN24_03085 [Sphingomonas sp.]